MLLVMNISIASLVQLKDSLVTLFDMLAALHMSIVELALNFTSLGFILLLQRLDTSFSWGRIRRGRSWGSLSLVSGWWLSWGRSATTKTRFTLSWRSASQRSIETSWRLHRLSIAFAKCWASSAWWARRSSSMIVFTDRRSSFNTTLFSFSFESEWLSFIWSNYCWSNLFTFNQ